MQVKNGVFELNDVSCMNPNLSEYSDYTDVLNNKFRIPNKLIVRLFSALKYEAERKNIDFVSWCGTLFQRKK